MPSSSPTVPAASRDIGLWTIILLGLVSAIGPVATDMYLPAFPEIDRDLGAGAGAAQFTLAAWFLGLAVGQFTQGPLSDCYGRRSPMMVGLMIFSLASIGCAMFQDYHLFCLCRFLSAVGGSAAVVIPRAVVRDVATGARGAKIMSQLTLVFGVMPVLAPSLGSAVLQYGSWRWIFWLAAGYGVLAMASIWLTLPDTLDPAHRTRLHFGTISWRYIGLIREPVFLSNSLLASFSTFVMFSYLGSAPVLFEQLLHFSSAQFGIFFGINAASFILGTQINSFLIHRTGPAKLLNRAVLWAIAVGALFLALALAHIADEHHPALICVLIMAITGALGFIGPNATILAFTHHGMQAGSASALLGTMQFTIGAMSGVLLGLMPPMSSVPTAVGMMTGIVGMGLANFLRARSEVNEGPTIH